MNHSFYLVNAFTKAPFKGNPAAVVILNEAQSESWMRVVAKEFNQPITTFLTQTGENTYNMRWFTPMEEVELCGHGTLGAAHVLCTEGLVSPGKDIIFHTASGVLTAGQSLDGYTLTFNVKKAVPVDLAPELRQAVDRSVRKAAWAGDRYILELESAEDVRKAIPDFKAILAVSGRIVITSRDNGAYDFISRMFAPKIGVNEDQVTGSAHCALVSYWAGPLNKQEFSAYQASERGGELKLKVKGEKVEITGDCVTLVRGVF